MLIPDNLRVDFGGNKIGLFINIAYEDSFCH